MKEKEIYDVTDIIDINYLQRFQDSLGNVTKITMVVLDPEGVPVTRPTNLYAFCAMMQASRSGVAMCMKTNTKLAAINQETKGPAILLCPNSGLKTASVPIHLNDRYLGSWLIGQMRTNDVNLKLIEETALRAGIPPEDAKKNISMLPIITDEEFHNILDLVSVMTVEITQLVNTRKKHENELLHLAYYDQRLDIPNDKQLILDINEKKGPDTYLICFDIQGLRTINDAYSRESGDLLLTEICRWIQSIRDYRQQIYRIDSDEFAVLVTDSDQQGAAALARRIWRRFEESWEIDLGEVHNQIYARISMGIIPCLKGYESSADLINMSVRILSIAKAENEIIKYDGQIDQAFKDHLQLEIDLKACVLNQMVGFYLHYQPIINPQTNRWTGLEALCRFESPRFGIISPSLFISEAERLGLINLIGEWVLEQAISQVKQWGLDQKEHFLLNVNLSPLQLSNKNLVSYLTAILEKYDYPANKLCLEITESAEVNFNDHIRDALDKICGLGISLSLDDFGTGYASYYNLHNLPVKIVKTDRSFVNNIENDHFLQHTIRVIVEFAHAAGMKVTAEGVETEEQKNILQKQKVDYFQGFYYAKPMPADQIKQHLDSFE